MKYLQCLALTGDVKPYSIGVAMLNKSDILSMVERFQYCVQYSTPSSVIIGFKATKCY